MGTRSTHGASCLLRVACEHLLAAAAPYPLFGSTLFVCLFVCLFACLFAYDWFL
jgi:integral membrane sensor domain MASE1